MGAASCDNGVTPDASGNFTMPDSNVTCTFTNTRKTHTLTVKKTLIPSSDAGKFDLSIGGSVVTGANGVGDGGSGSSTVSVGAATSVSEATHTGTTAGNYTMGAASCDNGVTPDASGNFTMPDSNVTCTFTNTRKTRTVTLTKILVPSTDTGVFNLSAGGNTASNQGNNGTVTNTSVAVGSTGIVVSETAGTNSDLGNYISALTCSGVTIPTSTTQASFTMPDNNVSCTVTNTRKGYVSVVKTVNGGTSTTAFTFELREGASTTSDGTVDETKSIAASGLEVTFSTQLTPGNHYELCEYVLPGWNTTLGGTSLFVPNSIIPPSLPNPTVNNVVVCTDFTAQAGSTPYKFTVNNTSPPGGRALTIGFWKNWASCTASSANKKPILDQTMAAATAAGTPEVVSSTDASNVGWPAFSPTYYLVLNGNASNPNVATDCAKAVNLLNKTTIDGKTKSSSDPAFNLAAQLLAAELNFTAGAGKNGTVVTTVNLAVKLLGKYKFNGLTHDKISAADVNTMNNYATILDNYNNDR
jgi:hypothetical protein